MPANKSGTLSLLRVHELGSGYGPPTDFIDVEVVAQFEGDAADAFGFQLRTNSNQPVRQGMLDLLRDAFNNNWIANIDFNTPAGKHNGIIVRSLGHQAAPGGGDEASRRNALSRSLPPLGPQAHLNSRRGRYPVRFRCAPALLWGRERAPA